MLKYYARFKMYSQIVWFWVFERFLTDPFSRVLWKVRSKVFQRKCSLGSPLSHYWGKIYQKDRYMESGVHITWISYRKSSLALKTFLTIASSHVLHWRKAWDTLDPHKFALKYTLINFKLPQQRPRKKTTSLIIIKT